MFLFVPIMALYSGLVSTLAHAVRTGSASQLSSAILVFAFAMIVACVAAYVMDNRRDLLAGVLHSRPSIA